MLEYLALRAGEVVSKSEILEHVWDFAYEGDPNIVEVYVSALRRKLGAGWISTVRGAGYRLVADACVRGSASVRSRAALGATLVVALALVAAGFFVVAAACVTGSPTQAELQARERGAPRRPRRSPTSPTAEVRTWTGWTATSPRRSSMPTARSSAPATAAGSGGPAMAGLPPGRRAPGAGRAR